MSSHSSIGIDIGGTKISAATVKDNKITSDVRVVNTSDTSDEILEQVLEITAALVKSNGVNFLGIATAGAVDKDNLKVIGSTGNLPDGYIDIDFKNEIEKKFKLPTLLENDANAAAYAEYKTGNGIGKSNVIVITLGTGVGGGIIIDDKLMRGSSGAGAECGHIIMSFDRKRKCTCGTWDCWEAYASGTGYTITANEMAASIAKNKKTGLLLTKKIGNITTYDIIEGLKNNEEFAIKVHNTWENHVLLGLVSLANIFDPECFILSGGMADFINYEKIQKELSEMTIISRAQVLPAKAKNNAGIIGAGILAAQKYGK